jgi:hypothetical protein
MYVRYLIYVVLKWIFLYFIIVLIYYVFVVFVLKPSSCLNKIFQGQSIIVVCMIFIVFYISVIGVFCAVLFVPMAAFMLVSLNILVIFSCPK